MANMLDKLNSEVSNNNGGGFRYRQPKNDILKLGFKHTENVRIIPYLDRDFWFPYRMVWVDLPSPDGKQMYSNALLFSYNDNGDDKLRTLVAKIIKYNFQYRADSKNDKTRPDFTGDKIPLQFKHPNKPHYNATLRPQFALQAINIVRDAQGNPTMKMISGSDIPLAQIMNVPKSVMGIIASSISSADVSYADKNTGKPFPYVAGSYYQARWINIKQSFPVHIELGSDNRYRVEPRILQPLGAINKALYAKDKNGKFLHLDDPAYIYAPTKEQAPQLWKLAYKTLSKRWNKEQQGNGGKSYAEPTVDQAKAVKKNVQDSSDNTASNGTNPYADPAQSAATGRNADDSQPSNPSSVGSRPVSSDRPRQFDSNADNGGADSSNAPADESSQSTRSTVSQTSTSKDPVKSSKSDLDNMDPNDIINNALKGGN